MSGEISIENVKLVSYRKKLPSLRLRILPINDNQLLKIFPDIINDFKCDNSIKFEASDVDEYLRETLQEATDVVTNKFRDMSPVGAGISFESVCKRILEANGYEISGGQQYDKKGGDIDFECKSSQKDKSDFQSGDGVLCVQVKSTRVKRVNGLSSRLLG